MISTLNRQRQQEIEKIEHANFTIQCKQAEIAYLQGQLDIMTPAVEAVKSKVEEIESRESHAVLLSEKSSQKDKPETSPEEEHHLDPIRTTS